MRYIVIALCIFSFLPYHGQLEFDHIEKSSGIAPKAISNKDWMDFLKFIKNDPSFAKSYTLSMLPDEWNVSLVNEENENSAVTNVSWQQAEEYCKWKSELATYLKTHKSVSDFKTMKSANKRVDTMISYRLPSKTEFKNFIQDTKQSIGFRCVRTVYKRNKI